MSQRSEQRPRDLAERRMAARLRDLAARCSIFLLGRDWSGTRAFRLFDGLPYGEVRDLASRHPEVLSCLQLLARNPWPLSEPIPAVIALAEQPPGRCSALLSELDGNP